MLSAPEPPDGGSPTPPPPALPLRFTDVIGSVGSAARTAPDDFLTSVPPNKFTEAAATIPNGDLSHCPHGEQAHQLSNGLGPGEAKLSQDSPDRQRKGTRHSQRFSRTSSSGSKGSRISLESPEVKRKTVDSADVANERPNPSEPIPIRTGKDY